MSKTKPSFIKRIEQNYTELPPNARKIADHLLHNASDVVSHTVTELANITHTSKATVSRFFRQLGYDSHVDVKHEMNELRSAGYPISMQTNEVSGFKAELNRLKQTFAYIDNQQLTALVESIIKSKRITLIGFRNSYPVALHFRQQLQQIHGQIRLLPQPGQTISEDLEDITADELVIVIGFRRRPKLFATLLEQLDAQQIVLFADPSGQIYKDKVGSLFICQLGQEQALDSYAAPMSLVSVICNKVLTELAQSGHKRVNRISERFRVLNEIE
ncbi:MurR/RpiR family transcriptional regulator [Paraglaciecola sp.]|uniref:MurR/RpiR family transcriptional regulator n=1 Tax=Paraglaciecola sp. TaxID=1920173 RepID=UPI0030F4493D